MILFWLTNDTEVVSSSSGPWVYVDLGIIISRPTVPIPVCTNCQNAPSASILSIKHQVSYVTCEEFGQLNIPQCISPPLMTAAMHDGKYMNQCTWSKVAYLLTIFPQLCYARQGCNLALPLLHCSLGTLTALWSKMLQLPHFCCGFGFWIAGCCSEWD